MNAEAVMSISTAVIGLTQLAKWGGVPAKAAPLTVALLSLLGVVFWGWSQPGAITRVHAWDFFSGWIVITMAAAGVFGFIREGAETVAAIRKGTGNGRE